MYALNPDAVGLVKSSAQRLREVVGTLPETLGDFIADELVRDRVTLRLILAIQDCISIAAEVAAQKGIRPKGGMGTLFETLADEKVIPHEMVPGLQEAVQVRNQILFDFDSIAPKDLFDSASALPETLVEFLSHLAGQER
jgi:uncharacterized protein YutE (UPF0331/DUF86 family)